MHATETRETRVVLVDGSPVLPRLAQRVRLGLVLKQVGDLPDQGSQGIGRCVGEQSEEGIDELGSCDFGLSVI